MTIEPYYDPEVREAIDASGRLGTITAENLQAVRDNRALMNDAVPLSDEVTRSDVMIPGPGLAADPDDHEVRLRIHRKAGSAASDAPLPCVFWMHGGGYVLGSPEQDDLRFDRWCQRFDLVGVCVQYRLGPEHPYPAGLEDAYSGLKWVADHADELGIDPSRIGIGGPSAGGGLAAALGLLARDRGEIDLSFQLLIYPMVDDTRTSITAGWDVPVWDPASNEFGWRAYLGELFGADDVPHTAAPARAESLAGLPPTYVMVGTLDGFCDEDIEYAARLNRDGVDVELHVYPGAPHGFDGFAPGTRVARQARDDINQWLGRMIG